jgi:hypothetical protein
MSPPRPPGAERVETLSSSFQRKASRIAECLPFTGLTPADTFRLICLGVWLNAADALVTATLMPSWFVWLAAS